MKDLLRFFSVGLILTFMASTVMANPTVEMHKNDGTITGHRYVIEVLTGTVGIYEPTDKFPSFCVEAQEYTADGEVFNVTISRYAVEGGPTGVPPDGDPLDYRTAYLYTEFMMGTYGRLAEPDINYNFSNINSFEALQDVIWHIEEESYHYDPWPWGPSSLRQRLYDLAGACGWSEGYLGNVRVMNMTNEDGTLTQDHLVLIPAPGAILLGGIGVCLVGWLRRRRAL